MISRHWAEGNILQLTALGAITGYPDDSFQPDNRITRAEFVTLLVKALSLTAQDAKVFPDTAGHWAKEHIGIAAAHGIVDGYNASQFGPDDPITREQMATILAGITGLEPGSPKLTFTDSDRVADWAQEAVSATFANGILSGYPDGSFRPRASATRAEAATVIVRVQYKVSLTD